MRMYPDKWELVVFGHDTGNVRRTDGTTEPYGSQAAAVRGWQGMRNVGDFTYTSAYILPPERLRSEPIVLRGIAPS